GRDWRHRWRLTLRDGTVVRWQRAGLASFDWVCKDDTGAPLILLCREEDEVLERREPGRIWTPWVFRRRVCFDTRVRAWPEAAFVLALGWYLHRLFAEVLTLAEA